MKQISTHILDLMRGRPAHDVPIRLERQEASGSWRILNSARTDQDGRCGQLLPNDQMAPGTRSLSAITVATYSQSAAEMTRAGKSFTM